MSVLCPRWLCRFLKRNRSKFIFTGVFIGGVYGILKFAEYKIKIHLEEERRKISKGMKHQKNFERAQEHCFVITEAMLDSIKENVMLIANTEVVTEKLKSGSGDKLSLWNDLKLTVFCRIATGVYSICLIALVHRVQMNQIAGLMLQSKESDASVDPRQQKFLSVSHDHMTQHGIHNLAVYIRNVAKGIVETMPLQCPVKSCDLETTLQSICSQLLPQAGSSVEGFNHVQCAFPDSVVYEDWTLVPPAELDDVEAWTAKSVDIVDSPDFKLVFNQCINRAISLISTELCNVMTPNTAMTSQQSCLVEVHERALPLAKSLPILNSRLNSICSKDFVQTILNDPLVSKFSLNVYESFMSDSE